MTDQLCITIRYLQPFCHARADQGQPEWPPSPLRLFQALTAAAAGHWNERVELQTAKPALQWLEQQQIGGIIAPQGTPADSKHRLYVPDNVADKVASSWTRGGAASIADHRTEKDVHPIQIDGEVVQYVWPLSGNNCPHLEILRSAARAIPHLGWGIDVVAGNAELLSDQEVSNLSGETWSPSTTGNGIPFRVPVPGSLADLMRKHQQFLGRLGKDSRGNNSFRPVDPLSAFNVVSFSRPDNPSTRPHIVFELRQDNNNFFPYLQQKLIHVAGMVRHLAIQAVDPKQGGSPPRDVVENVAEWVDRYVAGHAKNSQGEHRQLSYLPLPSIGHRHADHGVRRVMISAPPGDDRWLEHLASRLNGSQLVPLRGGEFGFDEQGKRNPPPTLIRIQGDKVSRLYTGPANTWASVTPVILPGHSDRKASKAIKLIERSLKEAGIEQPCDFEWSPISHFPKSLPAHKTDRQGRPLFYKPPYLQHLTAIHLTLTFKEELAVPGPLALGTGRHCGFGLMAAVQTSAP